MAGNPFTFDPHMRAATANLTRALIGDAGTDRDIARARHYDALTAKAQDELAQSRDARAKRERASSELANAWLATGAIPMTSAPEPGVYGPPAQARPMFNPSVLAEAILSAGGNADQVAGGINGGFSTILGAFGNDDAMRRSLVLQGKMPDADFAGTASRADQVSARNAIEDQNEAEAVQRLENESALAVQGLKNAGALDLKAMDPVEGMGPDGKPQFSTLGQLMTDPSLLTPFVSETDATGSAMAQAMTPLEIASLAQTGAGTVNTLTPDGKAVITPKVDAVGMTPAGSIQYNVEGSPEWGKAAVNTAQNAMLKSGEFDALLNEGYNLLDRAETSGVNPFGVGGAVATSDTARTLKNLSNETGFGNELAESVLPENKLVEMRAQRMAWETLQSNLGQFVANGLRSDRFSDADRNAANEALNLIGSASNPSDIRVGFTLLKNLLAKATEPYQAASGLSSALPDPDAMGGGIQPGAVEDGYQFLGGDPSKPENWQRVQ